MPGGTIVYLHGFRSSPASSKAQLLREAVERLPSAERLRLHVPALEDRPASAMAQILALTAGVGVEALTFVGSSLGGYYATYAAERTGARAVVINPAVRPFDDLAPYRGLQTNLHTGDRFEVTDRHFDELRALAVASITRPCRYLLLTQAGDELLDYRVAVAFYAGAWQSVEGGGDHGFSNFGRHVATIVRFCGAGGQPGFVRRS